MTLLRRLAAFLAPRREAAGQPPAPPPGPPAADHFAGPGKMVPVLAVGDPSPARKEDAPQDAAPLRVALRAAGMATPDAWALRLAEPCRLRGIHPGRRLAAFAATIAHESDGGRVLEESMRYSAVRLMEIWPARFPSIDAARPYAWDPADADREEVALAAAVYGGRMGNQEEGTADLDGWTFRGRGLIQITGRGNYRAAGSALGLPLLSDPDLAARPQHAAAIAAWWWATHGCNALADAGDVEAWRRRVNGGLIGLADVRRRYDAALAAIG